MGAPILRARWACSVHRPGRTGPPSTAARHRARSGVTHATVAHVLPFAAAATLLAGVSLLAGLTAGPDWSASAGPIGQWPVEPPIVTQAYHPPSVRWGAGHRGVDLRATSGQPVHSMQAGQVAFVGIIDGVPVVTVRYPGPDHRRSTYQPVVPSVTVGQSIPQGAILGAVAPEGGHCGGLVGCLHVGLRTDTAYLDPAILVRRPPAILKPVGRSSSSVGRTGTRLLVERGPRVSLGERRSQPLDRHVRIALRRRE